MRKIGLGGFLILGRLCLTTWTKLMKEKKSLNLKQADGCCLMSALANIPLKQTLAITGAVDQFGNVQSIGAVNEKIEGYYALCKERGLNGEQGVIIPVSNKHQLNLNEEVIDAVKQGNFHIYAVAHVEEALEILSSCRADNFFQKVKENTLEDDESGQPIGFWRRLFS